MKWRRHANSEFKVDSRYVYLRVPLEKVLPQLCFLDSTAPLLNHFTAREKQVIGGLLEGRANKEIGVAMNISERTVKFHVSSVLEKLNLHSRLEVPIFLRQHSHGGNHETQTVVLSSFDVARAIGSDS
jgi:DNA-binding NarL/FixJ family response regulator